MNADINLLRAQTSAESIVRTLKQELIEMAKYQPVRFHDFVNDCKYLADSDTYLIDGVDDDTYDAMHAAWLVMGILGTIPKHHLQPKPKRIIA